MAAAPVPPSLEAVPPPQPPPLSQVARILNTFIAPSKTFADLRRNASWWAPWLLISIVSLLFVNSVERQIRFEQVTRNAIAKSARADQFEKLPAEQQSRQIQFSNTLIRVLGYGSPIFVLFYFLIATVVLWATIKVGAGGDLSFKATYAILMYAGLPGIVGALLAIVSLYAGVNPEGFDMNNPVGTNLAYYLNPDTTGKFLRSFASSFDLINIWTIALIGIGIACNSKVKRSTATIVVATWYVVYKLLGAGLAAIS